MMPLDANDLILFALLMEAGSFSRAAERAKLPKSTLSRRITQLETRLGERLLTRSTRQLVITEFGERILEHAKRLLEETEAAGVMAKQRQASPRGRLRISIPVDFDELNLSGLLQNFSTGYPDVKLELDVSSRRVDLLSERFDIAVRIATQLPEESMLIARKICELQSGLYASPNYLHTHGTPAKPNDLFKHAAMQIITSSGEKLPWRLSRGAETWEGIPDGPVAANSPLLQLDLAVLGMGIVCLGDRKARKWIERGLLIRVLPEWQLPSVMVWCVMPCRRLMPRRTEAFIEMLHSTLVNAE